MDFIPYKVNEYLENTFYQVPKELFTNPYYKDSILLYALLLDRLSVSRKNEWIDEDGIKIDQEKLKTSSFYRLYVHYLYLFGKLPPKIHYEERTKKYYKEIDKFNKLADAMNLIYTYNLESKQDVQNLRMQYIEEVTPLKAKREKLMQLYKKTTNEADKTIIQAKIDIITKDINKINSKIQTCKRIISKAEKGEKNCFNK